MRNRSVSAVVASFFAGLTGAVQPVLAHPGHGNPETSTGLTHYFTEPMHVAPALGVAAVAAWLIVRSVRSRSGNDQN